MRKKSFSWYGIAAIIAFLIATVIYFSTQGPDLSKYEVLKDPRITTMHDQKMVEVVAPGDPNLVANKAFNLLFKTYFKIPHVSKRPAARARWSGDMNASKSTWIGYYALPVPEETSSLPAVDQEAGLQVRLTTWEYGEVAEILHAGPYDHETPTIERLHQFIDQQGYTIIGFHEEEYVKGPGMFLRGDPEKYKTVIRYRVKKR